MAEASTHTATVAARLLASTASAPLYYDTTGAADDETQATLLEWRRRGYCRIIHGPGPAWWCATALGRVQLTEDAPREKTA